MDTNPDIMAAQTKPVTYDDYRMLPDDGNQYQIIGGQLVMAPLQRQFINSF